jgi:hypothetical protein
MKEWSTELAPGEAYVDICNEGNTMDMAQAECSSLGLILRHAHPTLSFD